MTGIVAALVILTIWQAFRSYRLDRIVEQAERLERDVADLERRVAFMALEIDRRPLG
jgi:hypothetical protein